ncbi:MAG TPA: cyclic nucleotide-binding domain-containing protein [Mycobacteriales bacterium]|nr:cyclic nucleotide-binding domain-containing protein [Mycobacteriales bacterium]
MDEITHATRTVSATAASVSWIPSEAVTGPTKATFGLGITHYDAPPPDRLSDLGPELDRLRDADAFRFANRLSATAAFDGDRVVGHWHEGGIVMGATTVRVAKLGATYAAVSLPDIDHPVQIGRGWVRFRQTCGGRTALPLPRPVRHPPFVKLQAPIVWTTLALTLHADGRREVELDGASAFPRHWLYDSDGGLVAKAGLADYKGWLAHSFGRRTPWGTQDSAVVVTAAESALERELSGQIMHGAGRPEVSTQKAGTTITRQGDPGDAIYLLLDGVVSVDVDGAAVAELGPGAILGERAVLEGGRRTSTVTAKTRVRIATVAARDVDPQRLRDLATSHRREDGA